MNLGDFRIHELLGQGATARVYRGSPRRTIGHISQAQDYAIKVFRPGFLIPPRRRARADREVELLAALEHPNIVRYVAFSLDSDPQFYVSEYYRACALDDWRATHAPDAASIREIVLQTLRGLTYLHRRGVLHRDMKPQNVLVGDGVVRICDFGVARPACARQITESGEFLGTIRYAPPEYLFDGQYDERSDFFGLGHILHCVLHGEDLLDEAPTFASQVLAASRIEYRVPQADECGSPSEYLLCWIASKLLRSAPMERYVDPKQIESLVGFDVDDWGVVDQLIWNVDSYHTEQIDWTDPQSVLGAAEAEAWTVRRCLSELAELRVCYEDAFESYPDLAEDYGRMMADSLQFARLYSQIDWQASQTSIAEKLREWLWFEGVGLRSGALAFLWWLSRIGRGKLRLEIASLLREDDELAEDIRYAMAENGDAGSSEAYERRFAARRALSESIAGRSDGGPDA